MKRHSRKRSSGKQKMAKFMVSRCQEHRERMSSLCREAFRGRRPDLSNIAFRVSPTPVMKVKYSVSLACHDSHSPSLPMSEHLPLHISSSPTFLGYPFTLLPHSVLPGLPLYCATPLPTTGQLLHRAKHPMPPVPPLSVPQTLFLLFVS